MAAKSPTTSVRSREIIGVDQFSQRREVFDKHATVFLPLQSPTTLVPVYKEAEPIVTSNHGKTTSNFRRNTAGYSSMRESRNEERLYDFRPRKYSDNYTSELNQSDNVDYRHTMTERNRRLSKLRKEFLNSNLHDPHESSLHRTGLRASMPANSTTVTKYKIESPNLYKFPFAEPYATPTPTRRVIVDLGPSDDEVGKENEDPELREKPRESLSSNGSPSKVNHQKLFEELVKRYSPQRKPVDWNIPPTRPRVVGSVRKSVPSVADSLDSTSNKKEPENKNQAEDDDVFEKKEDTKVSEIVTETEVKENPQNLIEVIQNGPDTIDININKKEENKEISKNSLAEMDDDVPELTVIQRQLSKESTKRPPLDKVVDLTIPELIGKMTNESETLETNKKDGKKVKRKRSFLDKLLGRNKGGKK